MILNINETFKIKNTNINFNKFTVKIDILEVKSGLFSRGLEVDKAILNRLEHNSETICILDRADCSEIIINKELLELIKGYYKHRIMSKENI